MLWEILLFFIGCGDFELKLYMFKIIVGWLLVGFVILVFVLGVVIVVVEISVSVVIIIFFI